MIVANTRAGYRSRLTPDDPCLPTGHPALVPGARRPGRPWRRRQPAPPRHDRRSGHPARWWLARWMPRSRPTPRSPSSPGTPAAWAATRSGSSTSPARAWSTRSTAAAGRPPVPPSTRPRPRASEHAPARAVERDRAGRRAIRGARRTRGSDGCRGPTSWRPPSSSRTGSRPRLAGSAAVERAAERFGTDGDWARTYRPNGRPWRVGETVAPGRARADAADARRRGLRRAVHGRSGDAARRRYLAERGSPDPPGRPRGPSVRLGRRPSPRPTAASPASATRPTAVDRWRSRRSAILERFEPPPPDGVRRRWASRTPAGSTSASRRHASRSPTATAG